MGLREKLNENPSVAMGATIGIIVVALIFIIYSALPPGGAKPLTRTYFTVDDGENWFADDIKKRPPFEVDGKTAVRALVYRCGGKEFVGYMERYRPEAKKRLEAMDVITAKGPNATPQELNELSRTMADIEQDGKEYKQPKTGNWFRLTDDYAKYAPMLAITCEDKKQDAELIHP